MQTKAAYAPEKILCSTASVTCRMFPRQNLHSGIYAEWRLCASSSSFVKPSFENKIGEDDKQMKQRNPQLSLTCTSSVSRYLQKNSAVTRALGSSECARRVTFSKRHKAPSRAFTVLHITFVMCPPSHYITSLRGGSTGAEHPSRSRNACVYVCVSLTFCGGSCGLGAGP